jgi:HEAT repeat protein/beta-lactamase regulating signal transducer with metallopeptidase domain
MPSFNLQDISWLPVADAVAKATLLLALAALSSALLRRRSAAARHLVWTLALLAILALPVFSIALPRWQVPLLRLAADNAAPASGPVIGAPPLRRNTEPAPTVEPAPPSSERSAIAASASSHAASGFSLNAVAWPALLLLLWIAGAAAVVGRLAFGLIAVHWLARRTQRAEDAPWFERACRLATQVGVSSRVRFLRSARAAMPMACGVLRPAIVMPADADSWPAERLRIVLLHELAHVKRRDCLTHALAQLACALYWFNPLVWIAARHVRTERERACDDLVLASGTPGADYADQLLEIARVMRAGRFPAVLAGASLAMAYRSQLEGRLMAILDPKVPRAGISRMRVAAAAALAIVMVLPLASVQPWAYTYESHSFDADVPANVPVEVAAPRHAQDASPKPSPRPSPTVTARPHEQDVVQGVVQGTTQGVVQGVVQGATQGVVQGVTQGLAIGAIEGIASALPIIEDALDQVQKEQPSASRRSKADARTIAALTAALKDTDKDVRQTALDALVQLRDPSIYEPLLEALKDAAADVRQQAAFGLGQLRDRRALPALTAAVKDASADVRQQAVFALGQLRDPNASEALIGAVRDTNADVRQQAVFALGQLRDKRASEALISALKDADPDVRQQAAFALGQIHDRTAVEPLVIALKDSNADVRQQAAFALGQLDDARAIDALTAALKDPSADVRQQAAFALGQLAR